MVRALYAEDDVNVAAIVRSYIEHFAPDWTLDVVDTGTDCLQRMAGGGYDILILDLVLPDKDGLAILGELARRGDTTPVVMVSGHGQTDLAVRALRAGAADCVDKTSPQFLQLVDILKRVHQRHSEQRNTRPPITPVQERHNVLLIDETPAIANALRNFCARSAPHFQLLTAASATEINQHFSKNERPMDAVIIGANTPGAKPLDVLRRVHSEAAQIPTIVLSSSGDSETAVAAFKLGAQDFILLKPNYLTELVFSLNNALRRAASERENVRLGRELETLNRTLETQVATRTRELQALSLRLLRIQEDERRAIARELHDEVGQILTGLKLQLDAVQRAAAGTPFHPGIVDAKATADHLLEQVRTLTQRFRPRVLDDLGLLPALEWHARQYSRQTGIDVALDVSLPPDRFAEELETVVFRIVQEALTNIARHADVKRASVTITEGERELIVEISDRGRGFDVASTLARTDSLGLAGLRERIALAGGRLEIFSRPGQGTRIHAEFPLPASNPDSPFNA